MYENGVQGIGIVRTEFKKLIFAHVLKFSMRVEVDERSSQSSDHPASSTRCSQLNENGSIYDIIVSNAAFLQTLVSMATTVCDVPPIVLTICDNLKSARIHNAAKRTTEEKRKWFSRYCLMVMYMDWYEIAE